MPHSQITHQPVWPLLQSLALPEFELHHTGEDPDIAEKAFGELLECFKSRAEAGYGLVNLSIWNSLTMESSMIDRLRQVIPTVIWEQ